MDISVCTWSEYTKDGFLAVQLDAFAEGGRGISPFHHLSPLGLDARPVDPEGEIGALAWRNVNAHEGFGFPLNDVRTEAALPNLNKGATRIFDTGEFKGKPFYFTCTLDPKAKQLTIESHRAGGKIILKNQEGVSVEISGTTVKVTGATSVECGGLEQLTKLQPLLVLLQDIQTAMTVLAAAAMDKPSATAAVSKLTQSVATFTAAGGTTITKGA